MYMIAEVSQYVAVASFAEAWIEIQQAVLRLNQMMSPPSRRRGLKSFLFVVIYPSSSVASVAEAGLEIKAAL